MRVGIFLILLTLLAPFSYAQATTSADRYECTPNELSFGVNNAFLARTIMISDPETGVSDFEAAASSPVITILRPHTSFFKLSND